MLVQDYHLTLLAPTVRGAAARPVAGALPPHALRRPGRRPGAAARPRRSEMLGSLAAHDACGFHTAALGAELRATCTRTGAPTAPGHRHVFAVVARRATRTTCRARRRHRSATAALADARRARRRPPADRAGRPHGAVEEHRARASTPTTSCWSERAGPARPGHLRGLLLPVAAEGVRRLRPVPRRGRGRGRGGQRALGRRRTGSRSLLRPTTTTPGRSPRCAATTCWWSTRSATG